MAKGRKPSTKGSQQRTRTNPITKEMETLPGTKAGRKRHRLPMGHPLRTHDMHGVVKSTRKRPVTPN